MLHRKPWEQGEMELRSSTGERSTIALGPEPEPNKSCVRWEQSRKMTQRAWREHCSFAEEQNKTAQVQLVRCKRCCSRWEQSKMMKPMA